MPNKSSSKGKDLTSKAVPKTSSSEGKDAITGRTIQVTSDGRTISLQNDVIYEVIEGDPGTLADDIIRPLKSEPSTPPPNGVTYAQVQLGDNAIMMTNIRDTDTIYRSVFIGSTNYDKKGAATTSNLTDASYMQTRTMANPDRTWGEIRKFSTPYLTPSSSINKIPLETAGVQASVTTSPPSTTLDESGGGLAALRAFRGGKYFYEGWQLDPFNTSIV